MEAPAPRDALQDHAVTSEEEKEAHAHTHNTQKHALTRTLN